MALQLTNILRDVKKDLARGRLYIPLDDLARFGVHRGHAPRTTPRRRTCARCCAHQGARARDYYGRATRGLPTDDARRLMAAEIMCAIYQAILAEIELRDYDVFGEMVRVSRPRRALDRDHHLDADDVPIKEAFAEVSREVSRRFGGPM